MKKIALLLPLALALSACNSDKTSTTPTATTPYDATGNWKVTTVVPTKADNTETSYTFPVNFPIVMTNKATGDFVSDVTVPTTGKVVRALTGNTATGKVTIAIADDAAGNIGYADCEGGFNAAANSYYAAHCYAQGATAEQKAAFDKSGLYITLTMTRQ